MGEQLVERLRGMFAFALWDRTAASCVLARDRLGLKPLYVYRDAEKLVFGSEIEGHPGLPGRLADDRSGGAGGVSRLRHGPRRPDDLPGGSRSCRRPMCWRSARTSAGDPARRYWRLRIEPDLGPTADEWQEAIRAKLAETVRLHLIADVPVGAFLSGGIDSSIVVALAAGATHGPLRTFSMGFAEERFSELPFARRSPSSSAPGTPRRSSRPTP